MITSLSCKFWIFLDITILIIISLFIFLFILKQNKEVRYNQKEQNENIEYNLKEQNKNKGTKHGPEEVVQYLADYLGTSVNEIKIDKVGDATMSQLCTYGEYEKINFSEQKQSVRTSDVGLAILYEDNKIILEANKNSYSFIDIKLNIPEYINRIQFECEFEGSGNGLLTTFFDDQVVHKADERVGRLAKECANFAGDVFLGDWKNKKSMENVRPGIHTLAFRLDAFDNLDSKVKISNISISNQDEANAKCSTKNVPIHSLWLKYLDKTYLFYFSEDGIFKRSL